MRYLMIFLAVFLMFSVVYRTGLAQEYPPVKDSSAGTTGNNNNVIKYNPRIMVIMIEYIDGIEQPASIAQAGMEKEFLVNNFPLIDSSQMEVVKERDAVLSFSDPNRAAALGKNYGAEIVVVAEAKSNLTDSSQPYGVTVYAYESNVTAKAVKTDTAQVITSCSASAAERGSGRISTANMACEKAVFEAAASLIKEINESQRSGIQETTVQVVCSNADYKKAKDFVVALNGQTGIKTVYERSIEQNTAIIDVILSGDTGFLADLLEDMENGQLVRITAKSEHRIDLEFVE